jgi:heme/copper-type cytochrome/quinol oxidase subunit 4
MLNKADYMILTIVVIALFLSVYLWFSGSREEGLFVAIWVPSLIGLAIFFRQILWRKPR